MKTEIKHNGYWVVNHNTDANPDWNVFKKDKYRKWRNILSFDSTSSMLTYIELN